MPCISVTALSTWTSPSFGQAALLWSNLQWWVLRFPPLTWPMVSSCLRVWRSRGTWGHQQPELRASLLWVYLSYWCMLTLKQLGFCLPGHHFSPSTTCRSWREWVEQLPGLCWEGLPGARISLCSTQENPRLFLGLLGTGKCQEQFMCSNELDSRCLRRAVLYAKILEAPAPEELLLLNWGTRQHGFL